jgi:hypothetical protein
MGGRGSGDPRPPLFVAIGTVSTCVGCLSLLVSGLYEFAAFGLATSSLAQLQGGVGGTSMSAADEKAAAIFASIVYAIDLALAVLLLVAARLLLRFNRAGVWLHWLYAGLKLITSVVGLFATREFLGGTILGWVLAGPVLITAPLPFIYPIVLPFVLRRRSVEAALPAG